MTNNKQQTAVESLVEKLASLTFDYMEGFISKREYDQLSKGVIRQAKEMEKQRLAETWIAALEYGITNLKGFNNLTSEEAFEKYFNETYGGGNK
jgi:hypothetical protein